MSSHRCYCPATASSCHVHRQYDLDVAHPMQAAHTVDWGGQSACLLRRDVVGVEQRFALLLALGIEVIADVDILTQFGRIFDEQDLLRASSRFAISAYGTMSGSTMKPRSSVGIGSDSVQRTPMTLPSVRDSSSPLVGFVRVVRRRRVTTSSSSLFGLMTAAPAHSRTRERPGG